MSVMWWKEEVSSGIKILVVFYSLYIIDVKLHSKMLLEDMIKYFIP